MNEYFDPNAIKLLIDSILYDTETPITVSNVLNALIDIDYGNKPLINIIDDSYLDQSSIDKLNAVIKIYTAAQADLYELINELVKDASDVEELKEYIEELERIKELTLILQSMVKENMLYKEKEEEYIFFTLEDPKRKGESILSRDIEQEDSEVVLKHLLKMEKLVKSQLHDKGKFDIKSKGNGMHNHGKNPSHTLYKHVGDMIRIQVRRAGKKGNLIAVLTITPPSDVHHNANSEDARSKLYTAREMQLREFLNSCEKDEDGTYIISEEDLEKMKMLYSNFKQKLRNNIRKQGSPNLEVLKKLSDKISKNLEKEKAV